MRQEQNEDSARFCDRGSFVPRRSHDVVKEIGYRYLPRYVSVHGEGRSNTQAARRLATFAMLSFVGREVQGPMLSVPLASDQFLILASARGPGQPSRYYAVGIKYVSEARAELAKMMLKQRKAYSIGHACLCPSNSPCEQEEKSPSDSRFPSFPLEGGSGLRNPTIPREGK